VASSRVMEAAYAVQVGCAPGAGRLRSIAAEPTCPPRTHERAGPAAVIVGALGAPADPELEALLGVDGASELRAALAARARRWAAAAAPGHAFEAPTVAAAQAALDEHRGPVLLAAPDVPGLDAGVARDALDDLAAGCDVAVGVTHDARPYVIAAPNADSELLEFVGASLRDGVLTAFAGRGLTLGMLRHERRLASAADARALAIDPLAPADLAGLLRERLPGPPHR
jgi:uncharacterized protein